MADIMTFEELKGPIKNKKIAWLGDGNNVVYSLIEAAVKFDFQLVIASPKILRPDKKILKWAKNKNAKIFVTQDPQEAINLADCVMTDKWISMNDKSNKKQDLLRVTDSLGRKQEQSIKKLRKSRDEKKTQYALSKMQKAAESDKNLMPFIIDAVQAYATTGEISNTFREVFGQYRPREVF